MDFVLSLFMRILVFLLVMSLKIKRVQQNVIVILKSC